MLRRTPTRSYWHTVSKDLVPEGFRASRFHSNHTPHQRFNTQLEYALSPAFGGTNSGEYFPLVTLAVGENCNDPTEFARRYRKGLDDSISQISDIENVVYRIKYADNNATNDNERLKKHYKKYNKFYQLTTGVILHSKDTPWGGRNKEKMRNEEIAPKFNSLLSRINRSCLGVEVYLNICTSRNQLRGDRKVNPDNWIQPEQQQETEKATEKEKEEEEDIDSVLELQEKDLETDLKIFSELQQNLLNHVNGPSSSSLRSSDNRPPSHHLIKHNIRHCFPGHLPHPVEHAMDQYMGVEVGDQKIDEVTARWRERVAKFG